MAVSHGCAQQAIDFFDAKWKCKTTALTNSQHHLNFTEIGTITLNEMYGDCTAMTLYTGSVTHKDFIKLLPAIMEFLSINGRISCMFTRKTERNDIKAVAKELAKFPIVGLHIQQSNRSNTSYYQLTGILKVPNPFVKNRYWVHTYDVATLKHDHTDSTEFDKLNLDFGFN